MDFTQQYSQPQQPQQGPPKNWLVESILVTIFCCPALGIVGIVFASQVNSKFNNGDYAGAQDAAANAAKWTKIGFFSGLVVGLIYAVIMLVGGGLAIFNSY